MNKYFYVSIVLFLFTHSCRFKNDNNAFKKNKIDSTSIVKNITIDSIFIDYDTSKWTEITKSEIKLDLKYATKDNFVNRILYKCPRCFIRKNVAKSLFRINKILKIRNLRLKIFDCYRPKQIQQKLWEIMPDARYVTPPQKGSMHNRGLAVDITIIDEKGKELDMGTKFDYFGYKAYHTNTSLPKRILKNRILLKNVMQENGFKAIRTEWWHYSYLNYSAPISDWEWNCK
jgi:D-alanyl-D-alanine dipeptidase